MLVEKIQKRVFEILIGLLEHLVVFIQVVNQVFHTLQLVSREWVEQFSALQSLTRLSLKL